MLLEYAPTQESSVDVQHQHKLKCSLQSGLNNKQLIIKESYAHFGNDSEVFQTSRW